MRCLKKYGYEIDCSVTPGVDWSHNVGVTENSGGRNYKNAAKTISNIQGIIEVPVTIYYTHSYCPPDYYCDKGLIKKATRLGKSFIKSFMGRNLWLRPTGNNLTEMKKVVEMNMNDDVPYLMFMLHSSELMSGGSPTFPDVASIEKLYADLEMIFELISKNYKGVTLEEFVKKLKNNI